MFGWLFGRKDDKIERFKRSISINVVGDPDFDDFGPPRERIVARMQSSNFLTPELKEAVIEAAPKWFRNAGSVNGLVKKVMKSLPDQPDGTIEELKRLLHFETSRARHLHDLRRMEEVGVTHCTLMSARDERCTDLENELEGKRLTIGEARTIVHTRGDDISRSVFHGKVKF